LYDHPVDSRTSRACGASAATVALPSGRDAAPHLGRIPDDDIRTAHGHMRLPQIRDRLDERTRVRPVMQGELEVPVRRIAECKNSGLRKNHRTTLRAPQPPIPEPRRAAPRRAAKEWGNGARL
jgi:hypothetical protein